jgi:hypothetical protein
MDTAKRSMTPKERMLEARRMMEEARKAAAEAAREVFHDGTKELFATNPDLLEFNWTQYTPYFNDGDVCEFCANTTYPGIKYREADGSTAEDDDVYVSTATSRKPMSTWSTSERLGKAVIDFLGQFSEEDFLKLFGDHQKITVTRSGIETSHYEHD